MAFPTVQTTAVSQTAAGTSVAVNLPSGIQAGDLLILLLSAGGATVTTPAGWTEFINVNATIRFYGLYKIADGSEGSTVTIATGASQARNAVAYRITGFDPATAPSATTTSNATTNANPPSHTPAWGALDTLWIAVVSVNGSATGSPANYGNFIVSGGNNRVRSGERQLNAASEDPPAYTNSIAAWISATISVKPASSAPQFKAWINGM